MDFKKGYKTTEFWITVLTSVASFLVAVATEIPHHASGDEQTGKGIAKAIALAVVAVVVRQYVKGRSDLKVARNEAVASGTSPLSFASVPDVPLTARAESAPVDDAMGTDIIPIPPEEIAKRLAARPKTARRK